MQRLTGQPSSDEGNSRIWYVDQCRLDVMVEYQSPSGERMTGRPSLTLVTDNHTKVIYAVCSPDPLAVETIRDALLTESQGTDQTYCYGATYNNCMEGSMYNVPKMMYVDNGREFTRNLLDNTDILVQHEPVRPRGRGRIERVFGRFSHGRVESILDRLDHRLNGHTLMPLDNFQLILKEFIEQHNDQFKLFEENEEDGI